jgi:hypothetical protein
MKSKIFLYSTILLVLFFATAAVPIHSQVEQYDVDIRLQSDGSAGITENIRMNFTGNSSWFQRDLDNLKTDGYVNIQGSVDGVALETGDSSGMLRIIPGEAQTAVRLNIAPSAGSSHLLSLSYQVDGLIRKGDADFFTWQVFPVLQGSLIQSARITVAFPSGAQLKGTPVLNGAKGTCQPGGNQFHCSLQNIQPGQKIVLDASFVSGSLTADTPAWQTAEIARQNQIARVVPAALWTALILYLILSGIMLLGTRKYRQRGSQPASQPSINSIPSDEKPAVAARLAAPGNGYSPVQGLAALFSLCQQGVITIKNSPPRKFLPKDYLLLQSGFQEPLSAHEKELVGLIFDARKGMKEQVFLSDVGGKLVQSAGRFDQALRLDMEAAGLLDSNRLKKRQRLQSISSFGMAGSVLVAITGWFMGTFAVNAADWQGLNLAAFLVGGGVGVFFASLTCGLTCSSISILTEEGNRAAVQWSGFRGSMIDSILQKDPVTSPDVFDHYLPYAAGFGLTMVWVRFCQKQGINEVPDWLSDAIAPLDGYSDVSSDLITFMTTATASTGSGDLHAGF